MDNNIAYKVVHDLNGRFISVNAKGNLDGLDCIDYRLNETVYPKLKNSKLFVFDTLQNALQFKINYCKVFKCKITNPIRATEIDSNGVRIENFWLKGKDYISATPPRGTLFVDSVELLEEIV